MRKVTHRDRPSGSIKALGERYLKIAEELWREADTLDTAVRDTVAKGLADIVYAAYDCIASSLDLSTDAWSAYIDHATGEWFRARGFAEWFCVGASTGFRTSRPRVLSTQAIPLKRAKNTRKPTRKAKVA